MTTAMVFGGEGVEIEDGVLVGKREERDEGSGGRKSGSESEIHEC